MEIEEFLKRKKEDESWAPGWDEIDESFRKVYKDQEPDHFATDILKRAIFSGDQYLDGYSIYQGDDYKHIVTYGMSELYAEESSLGGEHSKWGYEMTVKLKVKDTDKCMWVIDMLSNLARYTFQSNKWFEPYQYIQGSGSSIEIGRESKISHLLVVPDTTIKEKMTIYGKLSFLQLLGLINYEFELIKQDKENIEKFLKEIKKDNPYMVLDMAREKEYLK